MRGAVLDSAATRLVRTSYRRSSGPSQLGKGKHGAQYSDGGVPSAGAVLDGGDREMVGAEPLRHRHLGAGQRGWDGVEVVVPRDQRLGGHGRLLNDRGGKRRNRDWAQCAGRPHAEESPIDTLRAAVRHRRGLVADRKALGSTAPST